MEEIYSSRISNLVLSPSSKNRISTSRSLPKSKTVLEFPLTSRAKPKEFYSLSRLVPNTVREEKEVLFEENLRLKTQTNEVIEENQQLKTKLNKLKTRKMKIGKKDKNFSLVNALKENINELNEKIIEKDAEIHKLKRSAKICKIEEKDIEIQEIQNECSRLQFLLKEIMREKDISNSFIENENKIFNKEKTIEKLNKDMKSLQETLAQTKEELSISKEKLQNTKKLKKTLTTPPETTDLRDEVELLRNKMNKLLQESYDKETRMFSEIKYLKEMLENEVKKSKNLEKELDDRQSKISVLENQVSSFKSESFKLFEVFTPRSLTQLVEKSKYPPRLLIKLNELAKERKLLMPVYLSLLDKNNNGSIEAEELCKVITLHGRPIKKKHVNEVLYTMNIKNNKIPIKSLEQLISKYEYKEEYESSSEELQEKLEQPRIEKLNFNKIIPDPRMNNIIIPQSYSPPAKYIEKQVALVKPEALEEVFERIRLQMMEKMVNKNRCINIIFGNLLDPEAQIGFSDVNEYLISGGMFFGSPEDLSNFGKFLIEPEGVEKMKESEYKKLKNKLNTFSKKLNSHLPNWVLIDKYKQHQIVYKPLTDNKDSIIKYLDSIGVVHPYSIKTEEFQQIMNKVVTLDSQAYEYIYLLSYKNQQTIFRISLIGMYEELENTERELKSLSNKHKSFIHLFLAQLKKFSTTFESVFNNEKEILINVENLIQCLKSVDLHPDDSLISDIKFGKYNCHLGLLKTLLSYSIN